MKIDAFLTLDHVHPGLAGWYARFEDKGDWVRVVLRTEGPPIFQSAIVCDADGLAVPRTLTKLIRIHRGDEAAEAFIDHTAGASISYLEPELRHDMGSDG